MHISNDAKIILYRLFNAYKSKLSSGIPRFDSRLFFFEDAHEAYFNEYDEETLDDLLCELENCNYIQAMHADDLVQEFILTAEAIVEIENMPFSVITNIADFIAKFKP